LLRNGTRFSATKAIPSISGRMDARARVIEWDNFAIES
jgi:hypothetical protein